jgi:hypothetical protein
MSDKCRWGLQKKKVGMDQPEQRRLRHHESRTSKQNYSMGILRRPAFASFVLRYGSIARPSQASLVYSVSDDKCGVHDQRQ